MGTTEPPERPTTAAAAQPGWLTNLLTGSDYITRGIQAMLGLGGVIALIKAQWDQNQFVFWASAALALVSVAWFSLGTYIRKRRPKSPRLPSGLRSSSSYLRGLLPFEKGESLLGREQEVGRLLALLRSLEYRVGFLSGEAGSGKTSLLRARVVPELEKDGYEVIYVARVGGDPAVAIRKALEKISLPGAIGADESPLATVIHSSTTPQGKGLVIIVDQFEEHFVINRTRDSRKLFEAAIDEVFKADLQVRLLFSLRKEFVDDLLDLATVLPDLQRTRWRLPLRNFSPETALEVSRSVSQAEQLRFSDALLETVIADLSRNEQVRPVEFQIVLTALLNQNIFDLDRYRAIGGAHSLIARFVSETIDPPDFPAGEVERMVARLTLRMLCNRDFTTRRPVGLTRSEIFDQVCVELSAKGPIRAAKDEVCEALGRVLLRLTESYILILEDEDRFNLIHDYLTSPVRDATANVETIEERATHILEQYIAESKLNRHIVLPFKTMRYIEKFADPEIRARTEASSLIRRSRFSHLFTAGAATLGLVALAVLILPFGIRYPIEAHIELQGQKQLSADGKILVNYEADKGSLSVLSLSDRVLAPHKVAIGTGEVPVALSYHGTYVLTLGKDGGLNLVDGRNGYTSKKIIDHTGWKQRFYRSGIAGFSRDESWAFAALADGRILTWPLNSNPREVMRLSALSDGFNRLVDLSSGDATESNFLEPPLLGLSSAGTWLWVVDANGKLTVVNNISKSVIPQEGQLVLKREFPLEITVKKSSDDTFLAFGDGSPEVRIVRISSKAISAPVTIIKESGNATSGAPDIFISPSNKWLVSRRSFSDFYVSEVGAVGTTQTLPAIELPMSHSEEGGPNVTFDRAGEFVGGKAQDQNFYVWRLNAPPRATAKPVIQESQARAGFFCPASEQVIVGTEDGRLYSLDYEKDNAKPRQVGRVASGNIRFESSVDHGDIFVFDTVRLLAGKCGGNLRSIAESDTAIVDVVGDSRGNIVIISSGGLSKIGRSFYLLGLPVWRVSWPAVKRPDDDVR